MEESPDKPPARPNSGDDILQRELYFLIFKFLEQSPLQQTSRALRNELERNCHLLPPQYHWTTGEERTNTTLPEIIGRNSHITADHLFRIVRQAQQALSQLCPPPVANPVVSLLAAGGFSLCRPIPKKSLIGQEEPLVARTNPYSLTALSTHIRHAPTVPSLRFTSAHFPGSLTTTLFSRQLAGPKPVQHMWPIGFYERFQKYHRILGHLSSVFCVLFDRTGRYLITGADDALIKIWSATTGRLLASLRGHQGEITDLSVSMENDMLASGSCDKKIRVWNLQTTALITTLKAHEDQVSGVKFCPLMASDRRYLVSISQDGSVCFFKYDPTTREFDTPPVRFVERKRRDSQLVSNSFSAGGAFFAVGSTDAVLYVYHLSGPSGPCKILEIEQHTDHVDSLQFSNNSMLKFISGGRDGLAHIWNYEKQKWHNLRIDINERLPDTPVTNEEVAKKGGTRVCMVAWTIDDRYVVTSLTDSSIKVWWAHNAKLKHILYGHEDEVYIIEPHPTDGRIILTGGHDGAIMIWDVVTGTNIKTFYNAIEGQGSGSLFDAKWSPDGTMFAVTDSYGHLLWFGLDAQNPFEKLPEQIFFHTDYRPLVRDMNDFVIDEQMQIAPHLMPPPFLVDIDGNPYPPQLQRLVPGREKCLDSQLIPYVDNYAAAAPADPAAQQQPPAPGQRQTIDQMIEQLQRNVDSVRAANETPPQAPVAQARNAGTGARDMSQRRNGDVEGVRNSANFVSAGGSSAGPMGSFMKRSLIMPFLEHEIKFIQHRQNQLTKEEEDYYSCERKKRSPVSDTVVAAVEEAKQNAKPFTRRQKRINIQRRGVRSTVTGLPRNRGARTELNEINEDDLDDEDDKDFTGTSEEESSEESEASADSDWNQPSTSQPVSSISRKRKRRQAVDSDTAAVAGGSSGDEYPEANVGSPSSRSRRNHIERREDRRRQRRANRHQLPEHMHDYDQGRRRFPVEERVDSLDERFRPPDWFTNSKPKRSPYFPQIGDRVVYFRQGHQNYIDAIRETKAYNINLATKPFKLRGSEIDEIFAKIVGIQYQVKPPRLVTLKMAVIDPQQDEELEEENLGHPPVQFSVRYHDIDHVCDFIILKQLYDQAIGRQWHANDLFRSVIDDKWWFGTVDSVRTETTDSYFQSIKVTWTNGESELLSPWDLEPVGGDGGLPDNHNDGIPVTDEERRTFSMIDEREWPEEERERDRQRLTNGFIRIMQYSHAEDFAVPVDLNVHPMYAMVIPYPIDLSTIMARVENNFYRRLDAVKFDVRFIETNATLYNVPGSEIVKKAKIITEICLRFINDPECADPMPIYNAVTNEFADAENDIAENSAVVTVHTYSERPRRSTRKPHRMISSESEDENQVSGTVRGVRRAAMATRRADSGPIKSWKQLCRELIDHIFDLQDSAPFRAPVDPILYPNYSHVIDTPMDLTTVKEQLLADVYDSPSDFCKDMRLIFTNSKTYNTNKKSRIYSMTVRLSALFEERMRKVMTEWKSSVCRTRALKRATGSASRTIRRPRRARSPISSPTAARHNDLDDYDEDGDRPSTSAAALYNHRSSQRMASRYGGASSQGAADEKYSLRHRSKRMRTYREDSDEDGLDGERGLQIEDEAPENGNELNDNAKADSGRRLRGSKRKLSSDDDDDDDDEEEEEEEPDLAAGEDTDKTENEEEEDDDDDEDESEEDNEEEDEEEEVANDSDATQVSQDEDIDDDNKENTSGKGRPVRAAARKQVNYDENDSDDNSEAIRERNGNVHVRSGMASSSRLRRNSFASVNESSRESMSSARSSGVNADTEDDTGRPSALRRSQRKIRPKRRYSSEESDHDRQQRRPSGRGASGAGPSSSYSRNYYDNSDLYSAVKTRHRTTHHHFRRSAAVQQPGTSSSGRTIARINYNEDDAMDMVYDGAAAGSSSASNHHHQNTYATRRNAGTVFGSGARSAPEALVGR